MSRPKVDEKDKRTVQVNIRLTNDEAGTLDEQAKASGLSPANLIRYKVFIGKFPPVKLSPLDASIYHELKKIGVNLNQATHKLHLGENPENLIKLLEELHLLYNRILKLLLDDRKSDQG